VVRTTDNGDNWTAVNTGLEDPIVLALEAGNGFLYAATYNGVFRSADRGDTWSAASIGLAGANVEDLIAVGTAVYAATDGGGVFLSVDRGDHWQPVNDGLASLAVLSLAATGETLLAGAFGGGVWQRPLAEMSTPVVEPEVRFPLRIELAQNFPNPFNPTTVIRYALAQRSFVSLKVFDVAGREVAVLLEGKAAAGSHSVHWNAAYLPSGIYFYQLSTAAGTATKKLMLLK
jgi:hypothetical protein